MKKKDRSSYFILVLLIFKYVVFFFFLTLYRLLATSFTEGQLLCYQCFSIYYPNFSSQSFDLRSLASYMMFELEDIFQADELEMRS